MQTIQHNEPTRSTFYKLAKELCGKEMLSDLTIKDQHAIGRKLLYMCFAHNISTSIDDQTRYGYGELDANGFWEFPINENDLKAMKENRL
jgi:hypothetical protein